MVGKKIITLSEVVVNNKLNVPAFIEKVKNDSSFYKAFRNLRIIGFTALNDIRMLDKNGNLKASSKAAPGNTASIIAVLCKPWMKR